MTRRTALAAIVGAMLLVPSGAAHASPVAPAAQGWWSAAQQAPAALPMDAVTGDNLRVGNDPTGPNAIAAVRYSIPDAVDGKRVDVSTVPGVLTLSVTGSTIGTPIVRACPATSQWEPAVGGEWSKRPTFSCTLSAPGTVSAAGTAVRFTLTPAMQARPGVYDLAIVPAPGDTTPFSVEFARAGPGSLVVTGGRAIETSAGSPPPAAVAAPAEVPAVRAVEPPTVPAGTTALPVSPEPIVATTPATGAAGATTPVLAQPHRTVASAANTRRTSHRGQRVVAFTLLAMLGAALWWFGGVSSRPARGIGPLESDEPGATGAFRATGGVGRFARPRSAPPR